MLISLTGFLSRVGLASGVKEGIQKLGRLLLEEVLALEDSAELFVIWDVLVSLDCPKKKKHKKNLHVTLLQLLHQ